VNADAGHMIPSMLVQALFFLQKILKQ